MIDPNQKTETESLSDALREARENLEEQMDREELTILKTEQEEVKPNDE